MDIHFSGLNEWWVNNWIIVKKKDNIINPVDSLWGMNDYFGFTDKKGDLVLQGQVLYLKLQSDSWKTVMIRADGTIAGHLNWWTGLIRFSL